MKAAESKDSYIPILHMPSRQIGRFRQCLPPSQHPLLSDFSVSCKCFSKTPRLFPHIRWVHMIENWQNHLSLFFPGPHDFIKLIQAPFWMSIVLRKNDNRIHWIFNSFQEWRLNLSSSFKSIIISEGANIHPHQLLVKMIRKIETGVCASKAQKDVPTPWKRRESWSSWASLSLWSHSRRRCLSKITRHSGNFWVVKCQKLKISRESEDLSLYLLTLELPPIFQPTLIFIFSFLMYWIRIVNKYITFKTII